MLRRISGGLNSIIVALAGFEVIQYVSLLIIFAKIFKELAIDSEDVTKVICRMLRMDTLGHMVKI